MIIKPIVVMVLAFRKIPAVPVITIAPIDANGLDADAAGIGAKTPPNKADERFEKIYNKWFTETGWHRFAR